jgi:hypothetical protein
MDGAPDGHAADFIRGVIRWLIRGSVQKETEPALLFGRKRRTYSRNIKDRRIRLAHGESRGPHKISSRPRQPRLLPI